MTVAEPQTALANRAANIANTLPQVRTESLGDTLKLAEHLARSGYFQDATSASQALVKILYGREIGVAPVTALMGIYVISGKPAPSAGLLASRIRSSKRYDYRIKRLDNEACELEFVDNGQVVGVSTFTQEDARTAGAHDGRNKHTWKAFARNMLFARALSNGARWYTPDLFGGPVYTPEELGAAVNEEGDVIDVPYVPMREQHDPAEATPPPQEMIVSADSRIWQRWLAVKAEAESLGIRVSEQRLPIAKAELAERGQRVFEAIETRKQRLAEADAERAAGQAAHEDRAAEASPAPVTPQGRAEEASPPSARRPSRAELWADNRRLVNKATELGLQGVRVLDQRSDDDVLISTNTELAERIRAHEAQLVGEPEQETI